MSNSIEFLFDSRACDLFVFSANANTGRPAQITDAMVCAGFEYSGSIIKYLSRFNIFFCLLERVFSVRRT